MTQPAYQREATTVRVYRHFGLESAPFETAPDPARFFVGPANEEAWAALRFVRHAGAGGCLLLGASGCGKTLHLRRLLADCADSAILVNGLRVQAGALIAGATIASTGDTISGGRFEDVVLSRRFRLAAVDDAEALSAAAWQELFGAIEELERLGGRLGLVVACGGDRQGELDPSILAKVRNRCLRHVSLSPLDAGATIHYVRKRLAWSRGSGTTVFTNAALDQIHGRTQGNPARIHWLCENALLEALAEERSLVTQRDIEAAAANGAPEIVNIAPRPAAPAAGERPIDAPIARGPHIAARTGVAAIRTQESTITAVRERLARVAPRAASGESRQASRIACPTMTAVVESVDAGTPRRLEFAFPFNVSRGGVGLLAERSIPEGTAVTLWLLDARKRPVARGATTVRTQRVPSSDGLFVLGFKLDEPLKIGAFVSRECNAEAAVA